MCFSCRCHRLITVCSTWEVCLALHSQIWHSDTQSWTLLNLNFSLFELCNIGCGHLSNICVDYQFSWHVSALLTCSCWSTPRRCRCQCGTSQATPFPSVRSLATYQLMPITWCSAAASSTLSGFFHSRSALLFANFSVSLYFHCFTAS